MQPFDRRSRTHVIRYQGIYASVLPCAGHWCDVIRCDVMWWDAVYASSSVTFVTFCLAAYPGTGVERCVPRLPRRAHLCLRPPILPATPEQQAGDTSIWIISYIKVHARYRNASHIKYIIPGTSECIIKHQKASYIKIHHTRYVQCRVGSFLRFSIYWIWIALPCLV